MRPDAGNGPPPSAQAGEAPARGTPRAELRRSSSDRAEGEAEEPAPAARAAPTAHDDHPAVRAYRLAFGRAPNAVQAETIAGAIFDLAAWQRVLTEWRANGWRDSGVAKMIDRYQKEAGPPADERPPSALPIHTHPGLSDEQRDRWIRRFRAAPSPHEQRALLARLEQEHPR